MLLKWIDEGSSKDSEVRTQLWTEKKNIESTADYIISLPEKVVVPSFGFQDIKLFVVQTHFKEDKWIKSVKFL